MRHSKPSNYLIEHRRKTALPAAKRQLGRDAGHEGFNNGNISTGLGRYMEEVGQAGGQRIPHYGD